MKLKNVILVDLDQIDDLYLYTYGIHAKSSIINKYFKLLFESYIPHYTWKTIMATMIASNIYFEHLRKGVKRDILIGAVTLSDMTGEDVKKYSTSVSYWKKLLLNIIEYQAELEKEFNEKYGDPNITGFMGNKPIEISNKE